MEANKIKMESNKKEILELFKKNVLGKVYNKNEDSKEDVENDDDEKKNKHCGSEGHWLEDKMLIKHNGKNAPDILGYEMKSKTASKVSFGDWCPDIDCDGDALEEKWWNDENCKIKFMEKYGGYNNDKKRWSWANPIKYDDSNKFGQKFIINDVGIYVVYNNKHDVNYADRKGKHKDGDVILFGWSHKELKKKVENKFGKNGYFRPVKDKNIYIGLQFGDPIMYEEFKKNIINKSIFLDPGTYVGNNRPYMQWRTGNNWFDTREENNLNDRYILMDIKTNKIITSQKSNIDEISKVTKSKSKNDEVCKTESKPETKTVKPKSKIDKITVLDLFCGCGGMTTGLVNASLDIVAGIDIWDKAINTYKNNHDHISLCKDLTKYPPSSFVDETGIKSFDVLVGGPPCQGFSLAGKRKENDPRNSLFKEYVKYLNYFKPKAFIMENVVGILSMKTATGELVKDIIIAELSKFYNCEIYKLSAADFEVPQIRKRVIIIGFRKDLKIKPTEPKKISPNDHIPVKTILEKKKDVDKKYFLSEKAIAGINKKKETMAEKGFGFGAQFLDLDKPSYTIPARYWKDGYDALVRYSDTDIRRLTVKELAKIQTFPPNYFSDDDSKKDVIMQIGNAVACRFAYHLGQYLNEKLNGLSKDEKSDVDTKSKKMIKKKSKDESENSSNESEDEKPKKINKKKVVKKDSDVKSKKIKVVSESEDNFSDESDDEKPKKVSKKVIKKNSDNNKSKKKPRVKTNDSKLKKKIVSESDDSFNKSDDSSSESDDSFSESDDSFSESEEEKPKKVNNKKSVEVKPKKKPRVKTDDSKSKKKAVVSDSEDSSSDESVEVKPKKKVTKRNDDSDSEGEKPKKVSKKKSN